MSFGRPPAWGAGGRRFKFSRPDPRTNNATRIGNLPPAGLIGSPPESSSFIARIDLLLAGRAHQDSPNRVDLRRSLYPGRGRFARRPQAPRSSPYDGVRL